MKKIMLGVLLVFGVHDVYGVRVGVFGTTIERNNIVVRLQKALLKYKAKHIKSPYRIRITNKSDKSIVVSPSIISVPLASYQEITKGLRREVVRSGSMSGVIALAMLVAMKSWEDWPFDYWLPGILGTFGIAYLVRLLIITEKNIEKEAFYEPITIQPGQTVEKLFWLKNPKEPFEINFDAVKIV